MIDSIYYLPSPHTPVTPLPPKSYQWKLKIWSHLTLQLWLYNLILIRIQLTWYTYRQIYSRISDQVNILFAKPFFFSFYSICEQLAFEALKAEYDNAKLEYNAVNDRTKILAAEIISLEDKVQNNFSRMSCEFTCVHFSLKFLLQLCILVFLILNLRCDGKI